MFPKDKGAIAFALVVFLVIPLVSAWLSLLVSRAMIYADLGWRLRVKLHVYSGVAVTLLCLVLLLVPYYLTSAAEMRAMIRRYVGAQLLSALIFAISDDYMYSIFKDSYIINFIFDMTISTAVMFFSFGGFSKIMRSRFYSVTVGALVGISLLSSIWSHEIASVATVAGAETARNPLLTLTAFRIVAVVATLRAARLDELVAADPGQSESAHGAVGAANQGAEA